MGFYTDVRGWLQVSDSKLTPADLESRLSAARREFYAVYPENRDWLPRGTFVAPMAFNSEMFIFIGCSLKNYDDDYRRWLTILCKHFPNASGRIDCQTENDHYDPIDGSDAVLTIRIRRGEIIEDWTETAWF